MRHLIIFFAVVPALLINGATLCVRPSATGSGSGTDWNNALGASFTPVRGNTYYIADGSYGSKTWSVANSGSITITIRKATASDHFTDAGWTVADGDGEAVWSGWQVYSDYWVFDGQWRTSGDDWDGANIDYGFCVNRGSTTGKTIRLDNGGGSGADNCTFRYLDGVGGGQHTGNGDDVVYGLAASQNITFEYCSLRDSDRTIFLLRDEWQNLLVQYCFLGRNSSTPAIHGEFLSDVGSDFLVFRYNIIEDTEGTTAGWAVLNGSGSKSSANTANGWKIYGNVIRSTSMGGGSATACIHVANDAGADGNKNWMDNLSFYNNTIVNVNNAYYLVYMAVPGSGNNIANNIFYNCTAGGWLNAGTLSHNWYFNTENSEDSGTGKVVCSSGCAAKFVSVPGNMRLASPIPGLSRASEYNSDMDGKTRGADGTWDVGAYEYVTGSSVVAPVIVTQPADMTVSVGLSATFTVAATGSLPLAYQWQRNGANVDGANGTTHTTPTAMLTDNGDTFRVVVTNSAGSVTSAAATLTVSSTPVNAAPTVAIGNPASGTNFTAPANITINASSSDSDGSVVKVEFFNGGTKLGEDSGSPYVLTWSGVVAGSYSLTARATDNLGATTTSDAVSITVGNAPSGAFNLGDRVVVSSEPTLRVRSSATLSGSILGEQPAGALGTVVAGPVDADGYTWWQINYDNAPDGWSIVGVDSSAWLVHLTSAAPPKPQLNVPVVQSDGTMVIIWTGGGTLQLAPTANGPWNDVIGAASPFTWTPSVGARQEYARIRK